jgi:hypothetical protein
LSQSILRCEDQQPHVTGNSTKEIVRIDPLVGILGHHVSGIVAHIPVVFGDGIESVGTCSSFERFQFTLFDSLLPEMFLDEGAGMDMCVAVTALQRRAKRVCCFYDTSD